MSFNEAIREGKQIDINVKIAIFAVSVNGIFLVFSQNTRNQLKFEVNWKKCEQNIQNKITVRAEIRRCAMRREKKILTIEFKRFGTN